MNWDSLVLDWDSWFCSRWVPGLTITISNKITGKSAVTNSFLVSFSVGSRDYPPLSEDTIFTCWYPSRLTRWCRNNREVDQEQAKTHHCWICRKTSTRAESCQICRMLCINTKGPEKCLWWSNLSSTWTSRATKEENLFFALKSRRCSKTYSWSGPKTEKDRPGINLKQYRWS